MGVRLTKKRKLIGFLLLALGLTAGMDAVFIEPNWIQVTYHTFTAPLEKPIKIAHLTDLHIRRFGRREQAMLDIVAFEHPDLIVITGDGIGSGGTYETYQKVLAQLHAPLGVWLVRGNWENWLPASDEHSRYASIGINFLLNEARPAREDVWVAGFDDEMSGDPNLTTALAKVPQQVFTIALFHSPHFFETVSGKYRLALAGHTHGGQVCLPLWGPLWLPSGCGKYLEGWYDARGSRMYVCRGVGTSILEIRFFCRPEIAFITVGK